MNTNESSRAVSPVVGVILVVAITVALSGVVGVFVFDLGQSVSNGNTQSDIGTSTTFNDDGTATIQVVTGSSDELEVKVNGTTAGTPITNPSPGDTLTVTATPDSSITVLSTSGGQTTVVSASSKTSGASPVTAPTAGLIAHWEFDATSGSTAVDSIDSNDGTLQSDATLNAAGQVSSGINLTSTGYVDIPNSTLVPASSSFTISAWVKINDDDEYARVLSNNDGQSGRWDFYAINSNTTKFWSSSAAILQGASNINDDTWHLVTLTRDGNDWTLYVDATSEDTATNSGALDTSVNYDIGKRPSGSGDSYKGNFDDLRIYNRSLSSQEVQDLYDATK